MADSDDEYERRRRDKFKRERNDYSDRGERRRETWDDSHSRKERGRFTGTRDSWSRRGREQYSSRDNERRRERYSPSPPPQSKRMRRDWDDRGSYSYDMNGGGGGSGGGGGGGGGYGQIAPPGWGQDLREYLGPQQQQFMQSRGPEVDYPTQPPLLTFKQFLGQQDDTISEEDAVKKYNHYKLEFQKQQIVEYFLAHKDEEWFKLKYHPEDSTKRKEEVVQSLKCRLAVFKQLYDMGEIDNTSLETDNANSIVKILDSAVILMEGGTEEDLKILDMLPSDEELEKQRQAQQQAQRSKSSASSETIAKPTAAPEKPKEPVSDKAPQKVKKRRDKTADYDSDSGSDSDSGTATSSSSGSSSSEDGDDAPERPVGTSTLVDGSTSKVSGKEETNKTSATDIGDGRKEGKELTGEEKTDEKEKVESNGDKKLEDALARAFHKTQSIFLRNLAPNITKQEVEALCKRYPGYLRLALQDPNAERKFFRRGWITFDRHVNIKDICWNLGNIRLRDCELGAIVNRELKQRVRPVNGLINHKQIVRNDIKLAAKIIQNMDSRWRIWSDGNIGAGGGEKRDRDKESIGLVSKNPVLQNITNYLVDEANLEDELLGGDGEDKKEAATELTFDKEPELIKVLDRLVWYLRVVYSIDFYNGIEYPNEHEMPHRCGIVHARGNIPSKLPTQSELNEFMHHFEDKVRQFTDSKVALDETESLQLGKKDPDSEVEKFITSNTQELAKDKWLCPLSGKKFKGPDFVRKHILNKHCEKVDEVKKEAMYFNNYLADPKRPALQEHPASRLQGGGRGDGYGGTLGFAQPSMIPVGFGQQRPAQGPMFGGPVPYGGQPYQGRNEGFGRDNRRNPYMPQRMAGGRRGESRPVIEYKDLDAPDDMDIF